MHTICNKLLVIVAALSLFACDQTPPSNRLSIPDSASIPAALENHPPAKDESASSQPPSPSAPPHYWQIKDRGLYGYVLTSAGHENEYLMIRLDHVDVTGRMVFAAISTDLDYSIVKADPPYEFVTEDRYSNGYRIYSGKRLAVVEGSVIYLVIADIANGNLEPFPAAPNKPSRVDVVPLDPPKMIQPDEQ